MTDQTHPSVRVETRPEGDVIVVGGGGGGLAPYQMPSMVGPPLLIDLSTTGTYADDHAAILHALRQAQEMRALLAEIRDLDITTDPDHLTDVLDQLNTLLSREAR